MCIWVAANNLETPFQLFLLLKLLYREGKTKLTATECQALAQMMGYADLRPLENNIQKLIDLKWIRLNDDTNYYLLASFDKIRKHQDWQSRASLRCTLKEISSLQAFIGAAIYTYQHKDFWRKVKRGKSVRIKGRTYHFPSPSFNYHHSPAPVATTGIEALYSISKSKASDLKNAAAKMKYIKVFKDYKELPHTEDELKLMIKYGNFPRNIKFFDEKFHLQLIDLILPNIPIVKRHNLGT
jgi:hypothetical protein